MKRIYYILLLFSVFTTATFDVLGQIVQPALPMVCDGSASDYKVGSYFHGLSDFTWRIYHIQSNGDILYVKPTDITTFSRGDSVRVHWNEGEYEGGIYTLEVTEQVDFGCIGKPYTTDIILNTNTIFIPIAGNQEVFAACQGQTITLDPGLFKNYFWTNNLSTNRTYLTTEAGTYQVRLVDFKQSCTFDTIQTVVHTLPTVWLGNDTSLFATQTLQLQVNTPSISVYEWYSNGTIVTGETSSSFLVDGISGSKTIKVTVTDFKGCMNSDEIFINAANYDNLEIPAAFTPNGDEINDVWVFPKRINDVEVFKLFEKIEAKVFNRSGGLVWENHWDMSKSYVAWDGRDLRGKELPMDSYHYIIRFMINGKTFVRKGSVTIIR